MHTQVIRLDGKSKDNFYRLGDYNFAGYKEIPKGVLLKDGYLCNPYVYAITNKTAENAAMLPTKVLDTNGNDASESNEYLKLLELMDSYGKGYKQYGSGRKVFIEKCIANLVALGEFFIYKVNYSVGFKMPEALDIISPADVTIQTEGGYSYSPIKYFEAASYNINTIFPDEMVFGKYPNINPYVNKRGLSPFSPNWDVVIASNNAFKAHGQLIMNMGANGILTPEMGENAMPPDDEERNFLQRAFNSAVTGFKNFMRVVVTNGTYKYHAFDVDANKLKILEMNEEALRVLCNAVNLDSKIMNDPSASTYNNQTTAEKSAYLNCYIPNANYFYSVMAKEFLPDGWTWCVNEDMIKILSERDLNLEKEIREQVRDGIITINEAREMLYPDLGLIDIQNNSDNGEE